MQLFKMFLMLMSPEGGAAGGGGAPPAGGGAPPAGGGAPPAGGAADPLFGGGNPPAGGGAPPPGGNPPAGGAAPQAPEWHKDIPDDVKALPFMQKYKTPGEIAKAYAHLEKLIGADKIAVPQKGTAVKDMTDLFQRLGLPGTETDYKLELAQGTPEVDKDFLEKFRKTAYGLNLLPEQAKTLVEWFAKENDAAFQSQAQASIDQTKADLKQFEKECGEAYAERIAQAKAGMREFVDPKDADAIRAAGLGTFPPFLRLMAKVGSTLDEAKIKGEGGTGSGVLTPEQARTRLAEIKGNTKHPYYDANHADHLAAKREMKALYEQAFPGPKKEMKDT